MSVSTLRCTKQQLFISYSKTNLSHQTQVALWTARCRGNQVTEMHACKGTWMKAPSSLLSLSLNDSLLWDNETRSDLLHAQHVDLLILYSFSL